jgi:cystathionine beta-lyase
VTLEFPDLRGLVRIVREKAPQAVVGLDNTWGAGLAFDAFDLGEGQASTCTIHALTKYPSRGDLLLGSVICRDDALARTLSLARSPRRAWRRCERRRGRAALVALFAPALRGAGSQRPQLRALVFDASGVRAGAAPGLAELAWPRALGLALPCGRRTGQRRGRSAFHAGPGRCLRRRAAPVSHRLVLGRARSAWPVPYQAASIRERPTAYKGTLVRFCLGLEDVADLIADAEQALSALRLG